MPRLGDLKSAPGRVSNYRRNAVDQRPTEELRGKQSKPIIQLGLVIGLLYVFLVGVKGLETGISAFGSNVVDRLFEAVEHPVAGLCAGILATVLAQSSSVTTAMIVGLVGAGALPLAAAVPIVMGANIGTTVTNTLASLGHIRHGPEFRRAFAGATMHDVFNVLAVLAILPLELAFGVLSRPARLLTDLLPGVVSGVEAGKSPLKAAIAFPVEMLEGALGDLPPVMFGLSLLVLGLGAIFLALALITRHMRTLMAGRFEASLNSVLSRGAGVGAMAVGLVMTVMVQSSSITTSILIPLVAAGVLTLGNAYPVTLGANLGTTVTALLASVAAARLEALTIALTHTIFNLLGILIFYPIPWLRVVPIRIAQRLADLAIANKRLVGAYVVGVFVITPALGIVVLG